MMDSEDEYPAYVGEAYLGEDIASTHATMTTKIPPAYNGRTSWFAYEELIDDSVDLTTIVPERQGPNLKNRLIDDAQMYKPLLERKDSWIPWNERSTSRTHLDLTSSKERNMCSCGDSSCSSGSSGAIENSKT